MSQRRITAVLAIAFVGFVAAVSGQAPQRQAGELTASANFDGEDIEPILRRLSSLVTSGFTKREAHELARRIAAQPMQTEQVYSYRVVRTGTHAFLRIAVWKDDPDACDVFFFAPTDLTTALTREIAAYMTSVGK